MRARARACVSVCDGIGCVRGHVSGQHVRPGLLGERDPEAHHQPAGRGGGVLRDQDRVVRQEHSILAPELLRPGSAVQKTAGVFSRGQERPVKEPPDRRLVFVFRIKLVQTIKMDFSIFRC